MKNLSMDYKQNKKVKLEDKQMFQWEISLDLVDCFHWEKINK